ncbi:hypothetical protein F5Y00DRAFT_240599 [Daldinia vernicosa]|uniref:uncharacterized protein n=1 Tax=Daldinia vernicosa TaxID=114800 RepID=UPI0020076618|nr:uncharacterized protein F5Y00DRAFT_240599 [Daldinia vernicosa]KAI0847846.1 hypothetical protein F5Y00DRAFT_240599 [Daldinia vernicosa]
MPLFVELCVSLFCCLTHVDLGSKRGQTHHRITPTPSSPYPRSGVMLEADRMYHSSLISDGRYIASAHSACGGVACQLFVVSKGPSEFPRAV